MQLEVNLVRYPAGITVKLPPPEDPDVFMARLKSELDIMFQKEYYEYLGLNPDDYVTDWAYP